MKLTRFHFDFWAQHKAQVKWFTPEKVSIHKLIPNGDRKLDEGYHKQNFLALLRLVRKKEELLPYLLEISRQARLDSGGSRPEKRIALAKKWSRRILTKGSKGKVARLLFNSYFKILVGSDQEYRLVLQMLFSVGYGFHNGRKLVKDNFHYTGVRGIYLTPKGMITITFDSPEDLEYLQKDDKPTITINQLIDSGLFSPSQGAETC